VGCCTANSIVPNMAVSGLVTVQMQEVCYSLQAGIAG